MLASEVPAETDSTTGETLRPLDDADLLTWEQAHLLVLSGPQSGSSFALRSETVIGRDESTDIRLSHPSISRRHAFITRETTGEYVLVDLGSRNGTFVNGEPVMKRVLHFGDRVRLGPSTVLLFSYSNAWDEQLLNAQKLESIGRLAGGIAHDFNNLHAVILANVCCLEAKADDVPVAAIREYLDDIRDASKHAAELTRQLLGFSRNAPFDAGMVNASQLVRDFAGLFRRTLPSQIRIQVDIDGELYVFGDAAQIRQILLNLLLNARDAVQEHGLIHIRLSRASQEMMQKAQTFLPPVPHIALSVEDTGTGMEPSVVDRIFEPFFTTKPVGQGSGLGLSTVHGVVKRHGGHIEVESETGKGSCFRIFLPESRASGTQT